MNIFGFRPFKGKFNLGNSDDIPENQDGTLIGSIKQIKSDLDECFQSVSNGKFAIASAITDKGVPTASDATFATMASNITNGLGTKNEANPLLTMYPFFKVSTSTETLSFGSRSCTRTSTEKAVVFVYNTDMGYIGYGLAGLTQSSVTATANTAYGGLIIETYTTSGGQTIYLGRMEGMFRPADVGVYITGSVSGAIRLMGNINDVKPIIEYLLLGNIYSAIQSFTNARFSAYATYGVTPVALTVNNSGSYYYADVTVGYYYIIDSNNLNLFTGYQMIVHLHTSTGSDGTALVKAMDTQIKTNNLGVSFSYCYQISVE